MNEHTPIQRRTAVPSVLSGLVSVLWTLTLVWTAMIAHNLVAAAVRGGSLDLRCIYSVRGYVESHYFAAGSGHETILCQYRPNIAQAYAPSATPP